jgi:hypothetical protein
MRFAVEEAAWRASRVGNEAQPDAMSWTCGVLDMRLTRPTNSDHRGSSERALDSSDLAVEP